MKPKRMAAALIFTGIFIASNLYTMLPLQAQIAELYHLSDSQASLSSSMFIFPYAIGLFFFGMLADKLPHKKVLLTGMASLAVVTVLVGLMPTYWLFIVLRALQGILAASFAPTAFAYSFEHFHGKTQAFVIAMINTGFLIAGIFGQMIAVELARFGSYRSVFFGFFILYGICFLFMKQSLVPSKPKPFQTLFSLSPILSFFQFRPLQKLYGIAFFLLFTVMMFYGSFEWMIARGEIDIPFSLQSFRMIGLVGIIPAFFAGPLQQRFGAPFVLGFGLLTLTIGFSLPLLALHTWTLLIASILMIASTSITIPMVILLVGQFSQHSRASAVSIYSFTLLTGASIGSIAASLIPLPTILLTTAILFMGLAFISFRMGGGIKKSTLSK
ncbi:MULTISPECIES: MFS transporter [Pontibacillus]|uniref:MFS transporter n=1 Tax=Pontibacillus chungwhensis TaxID=265426 RepID=A0ABY8UZ47_9BACI|nr:MULTISPECIES: MFS transporter [Pontibacillus]MCD5325004.1 MFS transporter [Pontibacillus sp. HN14]WIF98957.1 MFS transporter [Pontibacillus chungwhensis]